MTLELLRTIALLCQISGDSGDWKVKHYQLNCHKNYIDCIDKLSKSNVIADVPDYLAMCVMGKSISGK